MRGLLLAPALAASGLGSTDAAAQAAAPAQGGTDAQQGHGAWDGDVVGVAENGAGGAWGKCAGVDAKAQRKGAATTEELASDFEAGEAGDTSCTQLQGFSDDQASGTKP